MQGRLQSQSKPGGCGPQLGATGSDHRLTPASAQVQASHCLEDQGPSTNPHHHSREIRLGFSMPPPPVSRSGAPHGELDYQTPPYRPTLHQQSHYKPESGVRWLPRWENRARRSSKLQRSSLLRGQLLRDPAIPGIAQRIRWTACSEQRRGPGGSSNGGLKWFLLDTRGHGRAVVFGYPRRR